MFLYHKMDVSRTCTNCPLEELDSYRRRSARGQTQPCPSSKHRWYQSLPQAVYSIHNVARICIQLLTLPTELRYSTVFWSHSFLARNHRLTCMTQFLRHVLDELTQLCETGLELGDGCCVRAPTDVLVRDYAAQSNMLRMKGQGALQGCHLCTINGIYAHDLRKTAYLNNHSYVSPEDHPRDVPRDTTLPNMMTMYAQRPERARIPSCMVKKL